MFETIVKGFIIGLLVSAPMGPVNMLCVQRTLNKGRWPGFITGLGALLSDLIYALITLLGMSLVEDFLKKNELLIQL
ncbi:MAG TPA: LysE family transporter, partial [Petrimonas sp.]|nr:LysE family transporter [Petrimonas sp.]